MTLANIITIFRILLVPVFLVIILTEMQNKEIIAFLVFITASLTDALDGYVARKMNQVTDLGKFLDPLADKLLISAALLALVHLGRVAAWVAAVIIIREVFITGFRYYYFFKDNSFSASWLAKRKTLFQVISIAIIIIHTRLPYPDVMLQLGTVLLYVAVFLSVYSGLEYLVKYSRSTAGVEK